MARGASVEQYGPVWHQWKWGSVRWSFWVAESIAAYRRLEHQTPQDISLTARAPRVSGPFGNRWERYLSRANADGCCQTLSYGSASSRRVAACRSRCNRSGHSGRPGYGVAISAPCGSGKLRGARHIGGRYRCGLDRLGLARQDQQAREVVPGRRSGGLRTWWQG